MSSAAGTTVSSFGSKAGSILAAVFLGLGTGACRREEPQPQAAVAETRPGRMTPIPVVPPPPEPPASAPNAGTSREGEARPTGEPIDPISQGPRSRGTGPAEDDAARAEDGDEESEGTSRGVEDAEEGAAAVVFGIPALPSLPGLGKTGASAGSGSGGGKRRALPAMPSIPKGVKSRPLPAMPMPPEGKQPPAMPQPPGGGPEIPPELGLPPAAP